MLNQLLKKNFLVTLLTIIYLPTAHAGLAVRIEEAALNGVENVKELNGSRYLYGQDIAPAETQGGKYACARVVAATVNEAGVYMPRRVGNGKGLALAVWEVEAYAQRWPAIERESDLLPGDIVIYQSVLPWKSDDCKAGSGACHVGIMTRQGLFHNHPFFGRPHLGSSGLTFFSFKVGHRPPG